MAVVGPGPNNTALEMADSPKAELDINEIRVTRYFRVDVNDLNDGPLTAISAVGIPQKYQIYQTPNESQPLVRCRSVTAERIVKNGYSWKVTAEYASPSPRGRREVREGGVHEEADGAGDNPLLMLPEATTNFESFQIPVYGVFDLATNQLTPCKASNGETYDPPPTMEEGRLVLQITRNENINSNHPLLSVLYQNRVNSDIFWGAAPGSVLCKSISAKSEHKTIGNNTSLFQYLKVTYTFNFKNSWDTQLLDSGTFYFDSNLGKKLRFRADDGHPLPQGALDGMGHKLAPGANPVFNTFRFYQRTPFAALNLPQAFIQCA